MRSVDNKRIGISRLTSDYLNTTSQGEISRAPRAEAPVMWRDPPSRRDPLGSYYLLVSGLSGWRPNAAVLYLTLTLAIALARRLPCEPEHHAEHAGLPTAPRLARHLHLSRTLALIRIRALSLALALTLALAPTPTLALTLARRALSIAWVWAEYAWSVGLPCELSPDWSYPAIPPIETVRP